MINNLPTKDDLNPIQHIFTTKEIATFLLWGQLTRNKYRIDKEEIELLDKLQKVILHELKIRNSDTTTF